MPRDDWMTATPCPSADTLASFAQGLLPEANAIRLEAHLDGCAGCRLVVSDLAVAMEDDAPCEDGAELRAEPHATLLDITTRAELPGCYQELGEHGRGGQGRVIIVLDRIIGRELALKELSEQLNDAGLDGPRPPTNEGTVNEGSGSEGTGSEGSESEGTGSEGTGSEGTGSEGTEEVAGGGTRGSETSLARMRFEREARITGQLNHPTIIKIYEVGERPGGRLYYTMPLVSGKTLADAVRERPEIKRRLELLPHFVDICQGVSYAHYRGVIHRDLKPQNVMVGSFGETVILDWGLAKVSRTGASSGDALPGVEDEGSLTLPWLEHSRTVLGTIAGTPGYASPEQVAGRARFADERTDVWGLGSILYEILTGTSPFPSGGAKRCPKRRSSDLPMPVARGTKGVPPELMAITEKALRVDPEARYQSVQALAKDVSSYLSGKRVSAYKYHSWELLRRFVRRHQILVLASGVLAAVIIAALVLVSLAYRHEASARIRERRAILGLGEAQRSEHWQRLLASHQLSMALAAEADRLTDERQYLTAGVYAAAALENSPVFPHSRLYHHAFAAAHPDGTDLIARARSRIYQRRAGPLWRLRYSVGDRDSTFRAVFSPDGRRIAVGTRTGYLRVLEAETGHLVRQWRAHSDCVNSLAFTPDGSLLFSASRDRTVKSWDTKTFASVHRLTGHLDNVLSVVVSPDGQTLATSSLDATVRLWRASTGAPGLVIPFSTGVSTVAFSPDGRHLASGGLDSHVTIMNAKSGEVIGRMEGHRAHLYSVVYSPDGRHLASAGQDGVVRLWDPATGKAGPVLRSRKSFPMLMQFSTDSLVLAVAGSGRTIDFWKMPSGNHLGSVLAHAEAVNSVCYSPDGTSLVSAGNDGRIRLWEVNAGPARVPVLSGHIERVMAVAYSPDGRLLASAGREPTVFLWDAKNHRAHRRLEGHTGWVYQLAFSPDGKLLASSSRDKTVRIWSSESGRQVARLDGHEDVIVGLAFSPDGSLLASGSHDSTVRLWEVRTWRHAKTLRGHRGMVWDVAFSPSGELLASAGKDGTIRVWRCSSGRTVKVFHGHKDDASGVSFLGESRVASSGKDRRILVWDVTTGQTVHRLSGHQQWVNRIALSPDRQLLASASDDRTARIWSVNEAKQVLMLSTDQEVSAVAFSPDGRSLAVGDDKRVRIYHLDLANLATDPHRAIKGAERAAGLRLEGFRVELQP